MRDPSFLAFWPLEPLADFKGWEVPFDTWGSYCATIAPGDIERMNTKTVGRLIPDSVGGGPTTLYVVVRLDIVHGADVMTEVR